MRTYLVLAGAAVVVVAACMAVDKPVATHSHQAAPAASFTHINDPSRVDTGQGRLPDLIVDSKATQNSWRLKEELVDGQTCSAVEGGVNAGIRRILRFTVTTPNIGDADVFVGNPREHFAKNDGMFEFAQCHNHFHFKNYAVYRLIDANTGQEWRAAKRGFCMLDIDPYNNNTGDGNRNYLRCGTQQSDGFQGISVGWGDTYVWKLAGQFFVLDGGDGQAEVPPGMYVIEVHVNPPYAPDAQGNCPLAKDPATGLCHNFAEKNYANNIGRALISIPDHLGRDGVGPLKNSDDPTAADELKKP
jgi:hypothetical protein